MASRTAILEALLDGIGPVDELVRQLAVYGWDSDEDLVSLRSAHLTNMLGAYLNGSRTASYVERWAEAIECREDIGFEGSAHDLLKDAIFKLANPAMNGRLSKSCAEHIIEEIRSKQRLAQ